MTRETKIGIAMVLVLVGVFGFLVYKRATRPGEAVAQTEEVTEEDQELAGETEEGDAPKLAKGFAGNDEVDDDQIVPVAAKARPIPQEEPEDDVSDPFGESESRPTQTKASQPKLLVAMPDEEAETSNENDNELESFGSGQASSTVEESTAAMISNESESAGADPFGSDTADASEETVEEPVMESPAVAEKSSPVLEFESSEPDRGQSFGVDAAEEEPMLPVPVKQAPLAKAPVKTFEIQDDEPEEEISVSARASIPDRNLDFGEEEAEVEPVEETVMEPVADVDPQPRRLAPPAVSEPAPELMLDDSSAEDRYGGYEPIELADADDSDPFGVANVRSDAPRQGGTSGQRPSLTGSRHVVQAGESFWSISQKKYGTGRYFQALAAHNQRAVPDAAKMKPGVEIALPTVEELERRYPALVSPTGQTEPAAASGSGGHVRGEYLLSNGQPMYRIGTGDTLSDIAQRYLGRARRWEQILVMNRDVLKDGNSLKVGAILKLPSDATQLQLSNQPREFR